MSLLPVWTTLRTSRHSTSVKSSSLQKYRTLIVASLVLIVLTVAIDRRSDEYANQDHNIHADHAHRALDQDPHPLSQLKTLVLVACHSVYTGLDFNNPEDTSAWALLDYQKSTEGQTHSFLEHIMLGVEEAAKDDSALLLFSGGQTRKSAGPRAESMGYWMVAESSDWFGAGRNVRERAFTEEHSRDSLENVVFSLCRFYELTGNYPEQLTIVSYEFKEQRFLDVHRAALGWPEDRIRFVGTPALNEEMVAGEEITRKLFEKDPYGCTGPLREKRLARDPWGNGGYSAERCPALEPALEVCARGVDATRLLGKGKLPWWK